jgi:hypothetical protein
MRFKDLFFLCVFSFVFSTKSIFGQVFITEIMYNAAGADGGFEWVEFINSGPSSVDISGWKLSDEDNNSANWSQMTGSLGPGEVGIITQSTEAEFKAAWPTATNAKIFTSADWGSIANNVDDVANEVLTLLDGPEGTGVAVDVANYLTIAPWPTGVNGSSIYLLPGFLDASSNDVGSNWAASVLGLDGAVSPLEGGTYNTGNIGSPGIVAVPEPSNLALIVGLLFLVGMYMRRRD